MKAFIHLRSLFCVLVLGGVCSQMHKASASQKPAGQSRHPNPLDQTISSHSAKKPKPAAVLDRAWLMRKAPISGKLSFVAQLQKELETQPHSPENQARLQLAQAIVLLCEQKSEIAAVELIAGTTVFSKLNLSRQAVAFIWNDVFRKIPPRGAREIAALTAVAGALMSGNAVTPEESLAYFAALFAKESGDGNRAIALFSQIHPDSVFYRAAKLNEGLLYASTGELNKAKNALETVLSLERSAAEKEQDISDEKITGLKEYAALNLARLFFEAKLYKEAVALYRTIDSGSELFYESLSEQGWAFFLAGHPNRALGAEYGASSPFFALQFQPDLYFLRASVNYWLCDFKTALKDIQSFVVHTKEDAVFLRKWSIENISSGNEYRELIKKAYRISEGLAQGVSAKNSLLGPRALHSVEKNKSLMEFVKSASALRQMRKDIQKEKWPPAVTRLVVDSILRWEQREQDIIGRRTLFRITGMRADYERTLLQMRMIHMEIMTAEKDEMMSRGRSAEGQQFLGSEKEFLDSAERSSHVWTNEKKEFWRDELDSFVFRKKSQCNNNIQEETGSHAEK